MLKSICYFQDNRQIISIMGIDHPWSSIERGIVSTKNNGYMKIVNMEVTDQNIYDLNNSEIFVNDSVNPTQIVGS